MSRLARTLTTTAVAMLLATGPALAATPNPTLVVTQLPAQVRLVPGERIDLALSTNRTTGYTWSAKVSGDRSAVKVGPGVFVAPPETGMVGVPGTTTWSVKAAAPGKAVVSIVATPPGGGVGTTQKLTVIVMKAQ